MTQQAPTSTEVTSFWTRVSSLPLVQDGLGKVQHYANQTSLSRYALQQAETTFSKANEFATPYTEQYIKKADALGCRSLDILEQRFPAVTQPTGELVQAVRQSPQQLVSSVSIPVNKHMLTAAGSIENLVDKWLPPAANDDSQELQQMNGTGSQEQQQQQQRDVKKEDEQVAIARFYHLANNIKDRLQQRVHQRIEHIPRSKADVARLAETNRLLQDTVAHVQTINTQLHGWVAHSRNVAESGVKNIKGGYEATQAATQQRIHELTVELFNRLDLASEFLKERSTKLPDFVQVHLEPLADFAGHEYNIIRTEVLKEDTAPLQKATNILRLSHDYIVPLLQTSVGGIQEQLHHYSVYAQSSLKGFKMTNGAAPAATEPAAATVKA
ncbi:hypothetical protein BCR42DRAFT_411551 [Absidia repens]|uniref:Uncharacterized protein n=1 Tax=Absidia repens TaxID=90262 RepID=A0A1X2ILW9_9FUNG|nr:hypothetical protein BCR42DRAFT_411551 [Absidia repens]